jgi:tetratricopeptide (TPR) repeat protein
MTRLTTLCTAFAFALTAACTGGDTNENDETKELGIELPSAVADKSEKAMTRPAPAPIVETVPVARAPSVEPDPEPAPTTYREMMAEGKQSYADGDYDEALELFADAAAKRRAVATPRIEMARTLLRMDRVSKAREHAQVAIEIDPSSSYAWNTLGRVELAEGEREAAIASFERSVEENEDNAYAWNNLGLTLLLDERYEDAAAALESATSGSVQKAYMWNNLGLAYEHLDRIVEARAAYRQASDLGSAKGEASLERLEGVVSLLPADVEEDVDVEDPALEPLID